MLRWSTMMFDVMAGIFRLTAVLQAPICVLNRNTAEWYQVSLVSLPFLSSFNNFAETLPFLFYLKTCNFACPRVLGITVIILVEIPGWSTMMFDVMSSNFRLTALWHALDCLLDRNTVAWYPVSLIFLPFLSSLVFLMKVCRFWLFCLVCPFSSPMFLVSQWDIRSRSLVGQRWCLTWCPVIFVWLQCYMRPSACWIATLWHDTQLVWFSFHFELI